MALSFFVMAGVAFSVVFFAGSCLRIIRRWE